jgi:hypothetical protein
MAIHCREAKNSLRGTVLLQKVIGLLFKHFARGIRELHAKPIILAIYRWENLI